MDDTRTSGRVTNSRIGRDISEAARDERSAVPGTVVTASGIGENGGAGVAAVLELADDGEAAQIGRHLGEVGAFLGGCDDELLAVGVGSGLEEAECNVARGVVHLAGERCGDRCGGSGVGCRRLDHRRLPAACEAHEDDDGQGEPHGASVSCSTGNVNTEGKIVGLLLGRVSRCGTSLDPGRYVERAGLDERIVAAGGDVAAVRRLLRVPSC